MPQQVDPFMPLPVSSPARLQAQTEHRTPRQAVRSRMPFRSRSSGNVDGFLKNPHALTPTRRTERPQIQPPHILVDGAPSNKTSVSQPVSIQPATQEQEQTAHAKPKQTAKPRKRNVFSKLQAPLILLAAIGVGLLIQSLVMGEIFIIGYAIFALIRRVDSRTTFLLALFSLFCIILLLIIRSDNKLAANFAVYTFLLLAIGTITLGREVRGIRS